MAVEIHSGESDFGGSLTLSRQFFDPVTREYLWIESHEAKGQDIPDGQFVTAIWVPDGNAGGSEAPTEIHELVKWIEDFPIPAGMIEGKIPNNFLV
jgi:hypothetical protein